MAANPYQMKDPGGSPAGKGSEGEPDAAQAAQGRRKRRLYKTQMTRANLVLAGLFIAGAATVYGLSFGKGPSPASADQKLIESQVDAAILRMNQEAAKSAAREPGRVTQDLLKTFYDQTVERQIALEDLPKNPFRFVPPGGDSVAITENPQGSGHKPPPSPGGSDEDRAVAILESLRLQSVMVKPDGEPVAIISGNLVGVGQVVECFTVKKITQKSVVLFWRGREYLLHMR
jgi:hypothetical protein